MKYTIYHNSKYETEKKILLETDKIEDIIDFYNRGDYLNIIDFDDIMSEYIDFIIDNEKYDLNIIDYINNMDDIGSCNITIKELKELYVGNLVIIRGTDSTSCESASEISINTEDEIAFHISILCRIYGETTTARGIEPVYELSINESEE